MTIEQATVKMLRSLNLRDELAIDMVDLAIVSVIGYAAVRRILSTNDLLGNKAIDIAELLFETDHMNINELVSDFLGGSYESIGDNRASEDDHSR